jgi:GMP synthase-like glutamine amidotransferase
MNVHYLQHVAFEGLGSMAAWLEAHGHAVSSTRMFETSRLPALEDFDCLIVLGGPMGVGDVAEFPWLDTEREFIRRAIDHGQSILGICLGAQLIAAALGARVSAGDQREIGWHPLQLTPEASGSVIGSALVDDLEVFHWHGDTFELPAGVRHLASSAAFPNQAFSLDDRVVGLQFHLESTVDSARLLIENCGDEIEPAPFVQTADSMLARAERFARINEVMDDVLGALLHQFSSR